MSRLRVSLFGSVRVAHGLVPCETRITHQVQGLLAYILLKRKRAHQRAALIDRFWGDYDEKRARRCLSTTLWRLRQVLEPPGTPRGNYLSTSAAGELGFNWQSDFNTDVGVFDAYLHQALTQPVDEIDSEGIRKLKVGLRLYSGDLLEDFYDDWALLERERLRSSYIDGLAYLLRYSKQNGDLRQGLVCARKILRHDSLREDVHRDVMRLYMKSGQRGQAIRQYEACRDALLAELGITPMEETTALYDRIMSTDAAPSERPCLNSRNAAGARALAQLQTVRDEFEKAQSALERAIPLVQNLHQPDNNEN